MGGFVIQGFPWDGFRGMGGTFLTRTFLAGGYREPLRGIPVAGAGPCRKTIARLDSSGAKEIRCGSSESG